LDERTRNWTGLVQDTRQTSISTMRWDKFVVIYNLSTGDVQESVQT